MVELTNNIPLKLGHNFAEVLRKFSRHSEELFLTKDGIF